jgi:DNA-binding MarR family transcriptional regulator
MFFWDKHKTITTCYELISSKVCDEYGLTQMQYDILMFLYNNPQHNTAADIVKIRKSTKSHVSTSLKGLEDRELIKRLQSAENKKHIEIVLLEKAIPIIEDGIKAQKDFASNVLSGLTNEEKRICMSVFEKICRNADEYLKNYSEMENEK